MKSYSTKISILFLQQTIKTLNTLDIQFQLDNKTISISEDQLEKLPMGFNNEGEVVYILPPWGIELNDSSRVLAITPR